MADIGSGYREVPEEDRKKAKVFFDRGNTVAGTGNYDYAVEMYIQGLTLDPDAIDAHQTLRDISLKRRASGGKDMGMFVKMGLKKPTKDDKQNMLNAEKMLAFEPGQTDHMQLMLQHAHRAGCYDTCVWLTPILLKANADGKAPDYSKFMVTKDIMSMLGQWKLATDAAHYAAMMRPGDMDLQTELKNLGAQHTMSEGNYGTAKSFRDSVRNMNEQQKHMFNEKDVRTEDQMARLVGEAEAEWKADPREAGKLMKYVDALEKTEQPEYEARAVEVLEEAYARAKQFRFRHRIGQIYMKQWTRHERSKRSALAANPADVKLRDDYTNFVKERDKFELEEMQLWAENYPTEMKYKFEAAVRMFRLDQFNEAIPVFQQVRTDPKHKAIATIYLARAFLQSGFADEAADILNEIINDYTAKGDDNSKSMHYWRARALEIKGEREQAIKLYSQVAMWDFNYMDVQARVKNLRSGGAAVR